MDLDPAVGTRSGEPFAAVDVERGAGREGIGQGEERRRGDVVRAADGPRRVACRRLGEQLSPSASQAPVSITPGEIAFTRIGASAT